MASTEQNEHQKLIRSYKIYCPNCQAFIRYSEKEFFEFRDKGQGTCKNCQQTFKVDK